MRRAPGGKAAHPDGAEDGGRASLPSGALGEALAGPCLLRDSGPSLLLLDETRPDDRRGMVPKCGVEVSQFLFGRAAKP